MKKYLKYGIVTHYNVLNHGAVLQLEALIKFLKEFGVNAKALQYERNYDYTDDKLKSKYRVGLGSISFFLKFIKERGLCNFFFLYKKTKILARYRKDNNLVGPDYQKSEPLDGVIVGSDEVFALNIGKTPALFGYGLPSKKIFAYAGSFGSTTIEEIDKKACRELISNGLKGMNGLSVRDQNSSTIIEALLGKKPELVCDPVLLYGFEEELSGMNRPMKEKYMVVYSYDQNMNKVDEVSSIKRVAQENGLKIISPTFYHKWADKCPNVDPMGLLEWFKYAEFVVTDTFHGCVMSLITNREFVVMVRDNGNKIYSLMEMLGLCDRIIGSESMEVILENKLDWNLINKKISVSRGKSMDYLKQMISC